ncbi:MAG: hypothetical protein HJJLKODD_02173 [Phycisphaerae bacterium]|nr:hypothetical protein [Phycisphaerae bacterium]
MGGWPSLANGQILNPSAVTAEIRTPQATLLAGSPVWVEFLLFNPTDQGTILFLRDSTSINLNPVEMGLPRAHLLQTSSGSALVIIKDNTPLPVIVPPISADERSIAIRLAPGAIVGTRMDLADLCPQLREAGTYTIQWKPYDGGIQSNPITLRVLPARQVRMETDFGPMTVQLFYDQAPQHVSNFLDLAESGFYNGLKFQRVVPGYLIQGGAPGDDPAGIRPDGKLLAPEFNSVPFDRGVVGMARRPNDPQSASCQFFICAQRWPELDGQYTALGRLAGEESFATLERINHQPVDNASRPLTPIVIRKMIVEDRPTPASAPVMSTPAPSQPTTQPVTK